MDDASKMADACNGIPRTMSRDLSETEARNFSALKKEVDVIRFSLDALADTLVMQQYGLARDFETRIRHVYDDVINDINGIRKQINHAGDAIELDTKFKTWNPVMPFRKDVLSSTYTIKTPQAVKVKGSKSVDFVDKSGTEADTSYEQHYDKFHSKTLFSKRKSWLRSSQCSVNSNCSSRSLVPGFGYCFSGDGKTIPYRSYRAWNTSYRSYRHSWGPSRSGSRSTLDDDDCEDRGCMCGEAPDDWRVKVVPYMWEGWCVPGIDKVDIDRLRERMEQMESMRHDVVTVHNEFRRGHGCPDLTVTADLARDAQQWSDSLAVRGYAQYSDSQNRGENILVVDINDSVTGRQVVDTWYRESRLYSYKQPRWQRGTSNFTQMVWKASQFVGVGIAKFPFDDTYVVVVQYQPPGNINTPSKFRRNVPVPIFVKNSSTLHGSNVVANEHQNRETNDLNRNAKDVFVADYETANEYPEENPDLNAKRIQTAKSGEPSLDPINCNDISRGNGDAIRKSTWQTLEVLSNNDAIESDKKSLDEVDAQNVTALAYVGTSMMGSLNEMTHDDGDPITADNTDRSVTTSMVNALDEIELNDDDLPSVDNNDILVATHNVSSLNEMALVDGEIITMDITDRSVTTAMLNSLNDADFIETDIFTKDDIDKYEKIDELDTSFEAATEWNKQPNTNRVTIV